MLKYRSSINCNVGSLSVAFAKEVRYSIITAIFCRYIELYTYILLSVCVCVFSSHSFWISSSLDVPAGVTQEEGHTGFFIHLHSAVRALTFLARRIQPFFSLVDREVEFLCTNDLIVLHLLGIFYFIFYYFFSEKNPVYRDRTHVPTRQKITRLPLSYRGDRLGNV